jgi:hypothetical protein
VGSALHAAQLYEALGLSLLPVAADKRPRADLLRATSGSPGWARLRHTRAGSDELRAWFETEPPAEIGVITGTASGLVVVDLEHEALDHPVARSMLAITTPTATTPGGGRHLYFRTDTIVPSRHAAWGDLQAEGRYVVAPSGGPKRQWQRGPGESPFVSFTAIQGLLSLDEQTSETPQRSATPQRHKTPRGIPTNATDTPPPSLDDLAEWDSHRPYIEAMQALLGITVPVGVKFPCVLPGHRPDRDPSANLGLAPENGHVLYRCWQTDKTYTLAHVYAATVTGTRIEDLPWTAESHVMWKLRSLLDCGLINGLHLRTLSMPPSPHRLIAENLPAVTRYVQARAVSKIGLPAPFVPTFIGPWCGISTDVARELRYQLIRAGLMTKTGKKHGLADLYYFATA